MATKTKTERMAIAKRRLRLVLQARTLATWRTLEQKISDAGPGPMRVDPHILTTAKNELVDEGVIVKKTIAKSNSPWFHLKTASPIDVEAKLNELRPIHEALQKQNFKVRMGQTLEIAAFRAFIGQPALTTFGAFLDLDKHGDELPYKKEEPPSTVSGRTSDGKLDFMLTTQDGSIAGVELKNIREWLYPNRNEVIDFLRKCTDLNVLPVLIGRRLPYVTFKLLNTCGVVVHQTYNQLFPEADAALAAQASDKNLLGYHDIRVGNQPDARLLKFVNNNLPELITKMRPAFDEYRDLLADFANGEIPYAIFAARVRRRSSGTNEANDWPEPEDF